MVRASRQRDSETRAAGSGNQAGACGAYGYPGAHGQPGRPARPRRLRRPLAGLGRRQHCFGAGGTDQLRHLDFQLVRRRIATEEETGHGDGDEGYRRQ